MEYYEVVMEEVVCQELVKDDTFKHLETSSLKVAQFQVGVK